MSPVISFYQHYTASLLLDSLAQTSDAFSINVQYLLGLLVIGTACLYSDIAYGLIHIGDQFLGDLSLLDIFSYGNDLVLSALGCFDGIPL